MVASGSKTRNSTETGNSFAPNALLTACVFGANASGKSNIVDALSFFGAFVFGSSTQYTLGDEIPFHPFKLDPDFIDQPSSYEAVFISEGSLYQYGFSINAERVWDEWLFERPNEPRSRLRRIFERNYNSKDDIYNWYFNENQLKGDRDAWRTSTRQNSLFLSTAIQLNAETIKPVHNWVKSILRVVPSPERLRDNYTSKKLLDPAHCESITGLLHALGIDFHDIQVEEVDSDLPAEFKEIFRASALEKMRKDNSKSGSFEVKFRRKNSLGELVQFDLFEESDGTQALYGMAGPIVDVLANGRCLIVDELHNSLHPIALRALIKLFHDPEINKNNAQLIFTSHETSMMDAKIVDRDQIWLVEKSREGKSCLCPLSDFKVRKDASFQKMYLAGKFGALPNPTTFSIKHV